MPPPHPSPGRGGMRSDTRLPKPEAGASGAVGGWICPGRAPDARPAHALRAAGAFAPARAGADRAQLCGANGGPLALPCVSANQPGQRAAGASACRAGRGAASATGVGPKSSLGKPLDMLPCVFFDWSVKGNFQKSSGPQKFLPNLTDHCVKAPRNMMLNAAILIIHANIPVQKIAVFFVMNFIVKMCSAFLVPEQADERSAIDRQAGWRSVNCLIPPLLEVC